MRFVLTSDKVLYDELTKIRETHRASGKDITLTEVVEESVFFLYQINKLLENGYKLALIGPDGQKHTISRKKKKDEPRHDEDGDSKSFE